MAEVSTTIKLYDQNNQETKLDELFEAAYKLDINKIYHILQTGNVDVNAAETPTAHLSLTGEKNHLQDMFGFFPCGKVTTQIFERMDHLEPGDIGVITNLLKLLVDAGLVLGEVIFDKTSSEFCKEDSQYFWFTVIRKLLVNKDNDKYKELIKYLNDTLDNENDDYEKLVRTTKLYLAVEGSDHTAVRDIIEQFPAQTDYITYIQAMPGVIFPRGAYDDEAFLITPLTLALKHQDAEMVNILCSLDDSANKMNESKETWCWGVQPLIKRKITGFCRKRKLSLCLEVLRNDEQFFESMNLNAFKSTLMADFTLQIAKVILAIEKSNSDEVKTLLNKNKYALNETARCTYFYSMSILVAEEDIDREFITKNHFEKSLVLAALETSNLEILEHLENTGFDITRLGKFTNYSLSKNSVDRNQMLLWYLVIKYHLKNKNYEFLSKITEKKSIVEGPALVGCLFIAAQREDIPTLKQISQYFGSNWFTHAKYIDHTAYSLLVKNGLEQQAVLLQTYLGSHFTNKSHQTIRKMLREAETFEGFRQLIDENPQWLTQKFSNFSLLMILVTSDSFSAEKLDYLVEKEADIHMVTSEQKTIFDVLLKSTSDQHAAERLKSILQHEQFYDVLLKTPNFLQDLSVQIQNTVESVKAALMECFLLIINLPSQSLETLFFPNHIFGMHQKAQSIFEVIPFDSDLFDIMADKAFQLIGKEEKQLTALIHILRVHAKKVFEAKNTTDLSLIPHGEKQLVALFEAFFERLKKPNIREKAGYSAALEDWRDRYGMTFIMRLLVDNADQDSADSNDPCVDLLLKAIIEGQFFSDEYIDIQAELGLGPQFDLQHRLGLVSANKEKNSVFLDGQIIPVKRLVRKNLETGLYEPVVPEKDCQEKVISKQKVKISENGKRNQNNCDCKEGRTVHNQKKI